MEDGRQVTALLGRWADGDDGAFEELMPIVYGELRRLAERSMRGERGDHTLQATALVHEAYLRLARGQPPDLNDRRHFFAVAAGMMRRILVDHARGLKAARRGGGAIKVSLEEVPESGVSSGLTDLLSLDEALNDLAKLDERKAKVIELRFFGGLEVKETAALLQVSVPTVVSDTRLARAWLFSRIEGGGG